MTGKGYHEGKMTNDPRFLTLNSDPRFQKSSKRRGKIILDDRFKDVLKEDDGNKRRGGKQPKIDRYGRKFGKARSTGPDRFFSAEDQDKGSKDLEVEKLIRGEVLLESSDDEKDPHSDSSDTEADGEVLLGPEKSRINLERKKGRKSAKTTLAQNPPLDDDFDEEAIAEAELQAQAALQADEEDEETVNVIEEGQETKRFAVVNLDWDHIRALDLYKVFASFLPKSMKSSLISVTVFPSEFGKVQMKREEREGPPTSIFRQVPSESRLERAKRAMRGAEAALLEDAESDTEESQVESAESASDADGEEGDMMDQHNFVQQLADEGEEFDEEALREYQLNRLRYYYAIVDTENPTVAKTIIAACNGHEFERSANMLDLRYVPDDMTFDDEPRDSTTTQTSLNVSYQPRDFVTSALRHSKVRLTWDDDDPDRARTTRHQMTAEDLDKMNFEDYLASSSSDDDEGRTSDVSKERLRARYRALLSGIAENDMDGGNDVFDNKSNRKHKEEVMEMTFQPALEEAARRTMSGQKDSEETTIEKYQRKERERREKKKARKMATGGNAAELNVTQATEEAPSAQFEDSFFEEFDQEEPSGNQSPEPIKASGPPTPKVRESKEERIARRRAKEHLALLVHNDQEDDSRHFDMKAIIKAEKASKKKGKRARVEQVEDDFQMDLSDPRFEALQADHHYAIDPNNPQFKKTKNMQKLLDSRNRRAHAEPHGPNADSVDTISPNSVKSLIKSIKKNSDTEQIKHKKRPS